MAACQSIIAVIKENIKARQRTRGFIDNQSEKKSITMEVEKWDEYNCFYKINLVLTNPMMAWLTEKTTSDTRCPEVQASSKKKRYHWKYHMTVKMWFPVHMTGLLPMQIMFSKTFNIKSEIITKSKEMSRTNLLERQDLLYRFQYIKL